MTTDDTRSPSGRAPSGRDPRVAGAGRPRRRHAAARGRLVAAGLSAGAAVALVTAMGLEGTHGSTATDQSPPAAVVVDGGVGRSSTATRSSAPPVTRTDAPPVTTSRAS